MFLAPKPRHAGTPPTLGQVKDAFPLPGVYHFRFKSPLYPGGDRDKGAMPVWMDLIKDTDPIPLWKNGIVAKVTRISPEDDDDDDEDDHVFTPTAAAPAASNPRAPPSHQSSMASQGSSDHLDIFDGPASTPTPTPAAEPNLFDAHPAPAAPASTGGSSNLLDMNDTFGSQAHTPTSSSPHADFLGMTAPTPQQTQQPGYPAAGAPTPNMYQAQQRPPQQNNAFNQFSNQQGPFGGLGTPWK